MKQGDEIEVHFYATLFEDMESTTLMEWLMDNVPNMRVQDPGYRVIKSKDVLEKEEK